MSGRKPTQGKREQPPPSFIRASAHLRHDLSEADRSFVDATNGTRRRLAVLGAVMAILRFLNSPEVRFPSQAVTHLFEALDDVGIGRIGAIFQPVPKSVGRKPDMVETQVIKAAIAAAVDILSDADSASATLSRAKAAREISKWLGKGHYTGPQILGIAREITRSRQHQKETETKALRQPLTNPNALHRLNRDAHWLRAPRFYNEFIKSWSDLLAKNPKLDCLPARRVQAKFIVQVALAGFRSASPKA